VRPTKRARSSKCGLLEIPTPFRLPNSRVLLLGPAGSCAPELGKRLIALPVREDGNLIVLAFRADAAARNWARRERLAHALAERFGLNFPRYVRKMMRSPTVAALRALT
jgi:hypothetical protein